MVMYAGGLGDSNDYAHFDLPAIAVGGGTGRLKGGRRRRRRGTRGFTLLLFAVRHDHQHALRLARCGRRRRDDTLPHGMSALCVATLNAGLPLDRIELRLQVRLQLPPKRASMSSRNSGGTLRRISGVSLAFDISVSSCTMAVPLRAPLHPARL